MGWKFCLEAGFSFFYYVNYLSTYFGKETGKFPWQAFPFKENQFPNKSEKNNILLPHDICAYVHTYFGEDVVKAMGESSFDLFKKSEAARDLSNQKTVKLFFREIYF